MFYVAVADNWCNAAPISWVDKAKKTCRWPLNNITRAISKSLLPEDTWEWHKLKYILGPYRTYEAAKEAEIKAQFLSSDDLDLECLTPQKKLKTTNISDNEFVDYEYYTDSSAENKKGGHTQKDRQYKQEDKQKREPLKEKLLPNPPSGFKVAKRPCSPDVFNDVLYNFELVPSESVSAELPMNVTIVADENVTLSEEVLSQIMQPQTINDEPRTLEAGKRMQYIAATSTSLYSSENDRNLGAISQRTRAENTQIDPATSAAGPSNQHEVITSTPHNLIDLNTEVMLRSIDRKLDLVLGYLNHEEGTTQIEKLTDQLPAFPLTTVHQFENLCRELEENRDLRNQLNKKIIQIGGSSAESHLKNILMALISNKLGRNLTWEGQRQTNGIKTSAFASLIIGMLLQRYPTATHDNIKKCFSEWLRRSGDRYRYHQKTSKDT